MRAVHQASVAAVAKARAGGGPTLIVCRTQRFMGLSSGDPQVYRSKGDIEALRRTGDPIARLEAELMSSGLLDRARETASIEAEVAEAIRFAEASPYPEAREVITDVYA